MSGESTIEFRQGRFLFEEFKGKFRGKCKLLQERTMALPECIHKRPSFYLCPNFAFQAYF